MVRSSNTPLWAGLMVLTVVAYLPVWRNGFVNFDDELYITRNPQVVRGLTAEGFAWAWTNIDAKYWQPISWLSLQLDAHFFSSRVRLYPPVPSPAVFHGQNLFWHGASVLLLFALCLRLTAARWRSFLVAALFAVHPLHVESVAWAAERKDVLSVFFGLLTLWAYVCYVQKRSWRRSLGVGAAFVLSLLSKPMLITLPFVLLLLDYWPLRRVWSETSPQGPAPALGRLIREKVPLFVLAAVIGIVTMVARARAGAVIALSDLPLSARLANAATAYGWYLSATFCPTRLAVLYPHPSRDWSVLAALGGTTILVAITALAVWQARRRPWLIVGWLWFVGTLVPVIGLTQGGPQAWADRFSYFPHIGLFVAVVWGLAELVERLRLPALVPGVAGTVALGCLGVLTWVQVGYWRNTVTLWEHALAVTLNNHRAHMYLGRHWQDDGRFDKAEVHFAEAVRIRPGASTFRYVLGVAQLTLGKLEEAAWQFQEALNQDPENSDAWHNLGTARLRQGKAEVAVCCFRRALDLQPGSADTLAGLGLALLGEGKRQEAVRSFQAALQANQQEADAWRGLGLVYLAKGEQGKAIEAFGSALQARPALISAYSELGLALGRIGEWNQAIASHSTAVRMHNQAEEALHEMNGRVPAPGSIAPGVLLRCRLAFTFHQLGDRRAAADIYSEALDRDPHWPRKFAAKAWALATTPDADARDPYLAYEMVSQAIQATENPTATLLDTLAAAQAARGLYEEAVQTAQRALEKAEASAETPLVRSIRERQHRYQQRKPATDSDLISP